MKLHTYVYDKNVEDGVIYKDSLFHNQTGWFLGPPDKSGIIQSQSVVLYFVRTHPETHDLVMACHSLDFWTCDKFSTTNYAGGIIHKPSGLIVAEIYL